MKTIVILLIVVIATPVLGFTTNSLWYAKLPSVDYQGELLGAIFDDLEAQSKTLDPTGCGLRLLCDRDQFPSSSNEVTWTSASCSLSCTNVSILEVLQHLSAVASIRMVIMDDVGLVFHRLDFHTGPPHHRAYITGKAVDAISGEPLRSLEFTSHKFMGVICAINPDGTYVAILPGGFFDRAYLNGMVLFLADEQEEIEVKVKSPGYEEATYSLPKARWLERYHYLDIELQPADKEVPTTGSTRTGDPLRGSPSGQP